MPGTSELGGQHQGTEQSKATSGARNGFVRPVAVANIFRPAVYDDKDDQRPALPEKRRPSAPRDFKVIGSALSSAEFSRRRQSWDARVAAPPGPELLKKFTAGPSLPEATQLDRAQSPNITSGETSVKCAGLSKRDTSTLNEAVVDSKEPPSEDIGGSEVIHTCRSGISPSSNNSLVSAEKREKEGKGASCSSPNDNDHFELKKVISGDKIGTACVDDGKGANVAIPNRPGVSKEIGKKVESSQIDRTGKKFAIKVTDKSKSSVSDNVPDNLTNVNVVVKVDDLKSVKQLALAEKDCKVKNKELSNLTEKDCEVKSKELSKPFISTNAEKSALVSDDSHVPSNFKTVRRTSDVIAAKIQTIFSGKNDKQAPLSSTNRPKALKSKADWPSSASVPKHLSAVVQQREDPGIATGRPVELKEDSIVVRQRNTSEDSASKFTPVPSGSSNKDENETQLGKCRDIKNKVVNEKVTATVVPKAIVTDVCANSLAVKTPLSNHVVTLEKNTAVTVVKKRTVEKLETKHKSGANSVIHSASPLLSDQSLSGNVKEVESKASSASIISAVRSCKVEVQPPANTRSVLLESKKPSGNFESSGASGTLLDTSLYSERKIVKTPQKGKILKPTGSIQGTKELKTEKIIKTANDAEPKETIISTQDTKQSNAALSTEKPPSTSDEPKVLKTTLESSKRLEKSIGNLAESRVVSIKAVEPNSLAIVNVEVGELAATGEKSNAIEFLNSSKNSDLLVAIGVKGISDSKLPENSQSVVEADVKSSDGQFAKEFNIPCDGEKFANENTAKLVSLSLSSNNVGKKLKTQVKKTSSEKVGSSLKSSKRSASSPTEISCPGVEVNLESLEAKVSDPCYSNNCKESCQPDSEDCKMIEARSKANKTVEHKIYNLEKEEVINITLKPSADKVCVPFASTENAMSSNLKMSEMKDLDTPYSPTPGFGSSLASVLKSDSPRPPDRKRSGFVREPYVFSVPPPRAPLRAVSRTGSLKRANDCRHSFDQSLSILRSSSQSSMAPSHSYTPQRYSYTEMLSKVSSFGLKPSYTESTSNRKMGVSQVSELWADLNEEQSSGAHTSEMLEAETTERMRLEKETQELQSRFSHIQQKSDKMELEMMEARVYRTDMNGDVSEDEDSEATSSIYKQKYERAVRDMEIMKRRLQQQHEEEMEQKQMLKKATDKRLAEALEDIEEEKQVVNQWKRKAQKLGSELQDLRLMLEEQMARNGELEKKQRRFDAELSAAQEEIKKEHQLREKLQRERDQAQLEKYSLEQELHSTRLDMDMQHEKVTQLNRELDELTLSSKGEEEVTQLKRAKQELERKARDQEEELEELAGQVQLLEQAKLRLEMSLEKLRQEHRREISVREEEIEEIRASSSKKIKNLEAQLESEQEDRHQLVKQKHELERHVIELSDQPPPHDPEIERRLRRDLKCTKALLRDAQSMLEHVRDGQGNKTLVRQLKNQLEDAEFTKTVAVKARQSAELELQDLQSQLEEVTRTKNEAESRYLQLSREKSAFQTQLEEMEEEMAEVMKKYKAVVSQISTDQKSMVDQNQQILDLENEKQTLKEQLSEMASKLDHLAGQTEDTHRVHRLDAKVRDLESKLELEQTTHSRLEHQMARLKEQYDRMREECDSLRNKELQAQESTRRFQRQLRELREDYSALQQKESEAYRKQHDLEIALENTEADLQVTKNDLRLACQRIQDLQNALEDNLDSGTDVPDDSGSDSDSSLDVSLLRRHCLTPLQRSDSLSSNASIEIDGRQFRTTSLSQELSVFSKMMQRKTSMDFLT